MAATDSDDSLILSIIERVAAHDIRRLEPYPETKEGLRRAAVLMPLTVQNGEVFVLLTQRSKHLRTHPSLVALPGGIRDETDASDIDTALREAREEVGLPSADVQILGILRQSITMPNTVVYPVVGLIPSNFKPVLNPSEVECAFYMPLKDFITEDKVKMATANFRGKPFLARSVTHSDGDLTLTVWGFTANLCALLARIVFDKTDFFPMFPGFEDIEVKGKGFYDDFIKYFDYVVSAVTSKL